MGEEKQSNLTAGTDQVAELKQVKKTLRLLCVGSVIQSVVILLLFIDFCKLVNVVVGFSDILRGVNGEVGTMIEIINRVADILSSL